MIIYKVLRNIANGLKQATRRFVEAHIVQDDPCTSELGPDELEAVLRGAALARDEAPAACSV
jgi:hypothetical protein